MTLPSQSITQPNIELHFQITLKEALESARTSWRADVLPGRLLFLLIGLLMMVGGYIFDGYSAIAIFGGIPLSTAIICVIFIDLFFDLPTTTQRVFECLVQQGMDRVTYIFGDTGIEFSCKGHSSKTDWALIGRCLESTALYNLYFKHRSDSTMAILKTAFASQAQEEVFRALIRSKLGSKSIQ